VGLGETQPIGLHFFTNLLDTSRRATAALMIRSRAGHEPDYHRGREKQIDGTLASPQRLVSLDKDRGMGAKVPPAGGVAAFAARRLGRPSRHC
jgi:hypothetical protein